MKNNNKTIKVILVIFLVIIVFSIVFFIMLNNKKKNNIILVETDSLTLSKDIIYSFKAMCYPYTCELFYNSSNESVFEIDENGDITTLNTGEASLIIKNKEIKKEVKIYVTDEDIAITGVEIIPRKINLEIGEKYLLKTLTYPNKAKQEILSWTSSNPDIVNVNDGFIEAICDGNAIISIKGNNSNISDEIKVIVGKNTEKQIEYISFNEEVLIISLNESYQLSPIITPSNANNKTLSYVVDDPKILSVSETGLITSKSKGKTTVTAIASNGISSIIEIKVEKNEDDISINTDNITIAKGETYQLKSNYVSGIEWYSNNNKVATVTKEGIIRGISNGEAVITVINSYGRIDTTNIKVSGNGIPVNKINLDKNSISLKPGSTYKVNATITPSNATNKEITWETSDSRIAVVNDDGVINSLREGEVTITAYSSNGIQGSIRVSVKSNAITIDSLDINPADITIKKGDSFKLIATIIPSNVTDKNIIWKSSDNTVVSVNNDGTITGNKTGKATISATSNGITSKVTVTVTNVSNIIELTSLKINESSFDLEIGKVKALTTDYLPTNATNKDFIWTSGDNSVASVSNKGIITALKVGTADITVSSTNGLKSSIKVTVKGNNSSPILDNIPVTEIYLSLENINLHLGKTKQLKATVLPLNASNKSVTWVSGNESVVKVSESGLLTAIKPGSTQISAISVNGKIAKTNVMVTYPPIFDQGNKLIEMYSDKLIVTMTQETTLKAKIIRVWVADPYKQFHKIDTDTSGGTLVSDLLNKAIINNGLTNSILIGGNASVTKSNRSKHMGNLVITEGQVRLNNPGGPDRYADGGNAVFYGINSSGDLKAYGPAKNTKEETTLFSQIINDGVRNTIGITSEYVTVLNGKIAISDWDKRYAIRNSICQVNKNNFILIVSTNGDRMIEIAKLQQAYKCITGLNLDGGGSVNLFYKNRGSNTVNSIHSTTRPRSEAIYFSEY